MIQGVPYNLVNLYLLNWEFMKEVYCVEFTLGLVKKSNHFAFQRFSDIEKYHSHMAHSKFSTANI